MKVWTLALSFLVCCIINSAQAQPWMDSVTSTNPTLGEIKQAFYNYWGENTIETVERSHGYKPFKRWEWFWSERIKNSDTIPRPSINWEEWVKYVKAHPATAQRTTSDANWAFQGPSTTNGGYAGIGRINCIGFHPTIPTTFWIGTGAGGLWKTTDNGNTWTTNYDLMPVLGVSDIAIDPRS